MLKHNAMAYPNDEKLKSNCKLLNKPAIFYQKPAKPKASRDFAKHIGGKAVSQAYPHYLVAKKFNINIVGETVDSAWWSFVHGFSRRMRLLPPDHSTLRK